MKKILFILLIIILLPSVSFSGEYLLLKGKNEDVCKTYLKNLNSFPNWPLMACERSFSEKIPNLKGIDWQPDYIEKDRERVILDKDVWEKIFTFVDSRNFPKKEPYDYPGYGILTAEIDIDNDGLMETVYKSEKFLCKSSKTYAIHLVVYDRNKNDIDMNKTKKVLSSAIRDNVVISDGVMFDAFTYKEKTYFDMWDDRGFVNDPEKLTVYLFKNNQVQEKCVYKHRKKKQGYSGDIRLNY